MTSNRNERHFLHGFVPAVLIGLVSSAAGAQAPQNLAADAANWWKDITVLASDSLQGRMTGSQGYRTAAAYVAQKFKDAGLVGAGTAGFYQPVKFKRIELDEAASSVELVDGAKTSPLTFGREVIVSAVDNPAGEVDAGAVFVGYGISAPEANYNDLSSLDLHGKIAVYLAGGPETIKDPLRAHKESSGERWKAMKAAGAVGTVVIFNTANQEIAWDRIAGNRHKPSLELADASLRQDQGKLLAMEVNPQFADMFFAGSGHTMAEILDAARAKKPLPTFPLHVKIHAKTKVSTADLESPNVVGELEGTDPALKQQFVIVSAHLDHLGVGAPVNGDSIYNGAMDNASGVASLIQIAHDFRAAGAKPKRSVVFLAVGARRKESLARGTSPIARASRPMTSSPTSTWTCTCHSFRSCTCRCRASTSRRWATTSRQSAPKMVSRSSKTSSRVRIGSSAAISTASSSEASRRSRSSSGMCKARPRTRHSIPGCTRATTSRQTTSISPSTARQLPSSATCCTC